VTSQTAYMQLH